MQNRRSDYTQIQTRTITLKFLRFSQTLHETNILPRISTAHSNRSLEVTKSTSRIWITIWTQRFQLARTVRRTMKIARLTCYVINQSHTNLVAAVVTSIFWESRIQSRINPVSKICIRYSDIRQLVVNCTEHSGKPNTSVAPSISPYRLHVVHIAIFVPSCSKRYITDWILKTWYLWRGLKVKKAYSPLSVLAFRISKKKFQRIPSTRQTSRTFINTNSE